MQKQQSVFSEYFGTMSGNNLAKHRLETAKQDWELFVQKYWRADSVSHESFMVFDFIVFADEYLSKPSPVSSKELKEIAENFIEDSLDVAENFIERILRIKETIYDLDVPQNQGITISTGFERALNAGLSPSHLEKIKLQKKGVSRFLSKISEKENQASFLQGWLQSQDAKLFFKTYSMLRSEVIKHGPLKQRRRLTSSLSND